VGGEVQARVVKLPVVKAVETLIETGDFSVSTMATTCRTKTKSTKIRVEEFSVHGEQTR
jgi:hypothetical protein